MAPLTSIENLPTKMAANYAHGRIPCIKINQIHSFSNSHFEWSIVMHCVCTCGFCYDCDNVLSKQCIVQSLEGSMLFGTISMLEPSLAAKTSKRITA